MPQAFARRRAQTRDAALSCTGMQVWLSLASDAGDAQAFGDAIGPDADRRTDRRTNRRANRLHGDSGEGNSLSTAPARKAPIEPPWPLPLVHFLLLQQVAPAAASVRLRAHVFS